MTSWAKSRDELVAERAQQKLAEERAEHLKIAEQSVMQAGGILSQAYSRLSKGQFHLDDVIMLSAVSSKANQAAARIAQALKTTGVQEATPEEQSQIIV